MKAECVLHWYDANRREFPWRSFNAQNINPYHVWLSEIMLQQTTTSTVVPYFETFLKKWPSVKALSEANIDEVLQAWAGLGYYSRARNLHLCSQILVQEHNECFPDVESELLKLPGIGPYTAAAISAIAYDQPTSPVDGNIARILSRVFKIETKQPQLNKDVKQELSKIVPSKRNGDFVQALMDIGAIICSPKNPNCEQCPMVSCCQAFKTKCQNDYPKKNPSKSRPTKYGYFFWIEDEEGRVFLRKRPSRGLLGGMLEIPSSPWEASLIEHKSAALYSPIKTDAWLPMGFIEHTFTHFHLIMHIIKGKVARNHSGLWVNPPEFNKYPLPTLMKKVAVEVSKTS